MTLLSINVLLCFQTKLLQKLRWQSINNHKNNSQVITLNWVKLVRQTGQYETSDLIVLQKDNIVILANQRKF